MNFVYRSILAGHLVSLAGTLFLAAPALARRDDAPVRPDRHNDAASLRQARQALRNEHESQIQTGRERRLSESIVNTPNNSLDRSALLNSFRGRIRNEGQSLFINSNDKVRAVTRGLELDLTSSERSITLGENLFANATSYTVRFGDQEKVVKAGSQVSPAEFVALQQVINGGKQDLVLDSSGRGIDGKFSFHSITDGGTGIHAKSLVIPNSVDATGNLSRSSDFRLTGDLVNNGNIYLNDKIDGSSIASRDIKNSSGASINSTGDLTLLASRDLLNDGTISSDGKLTIDAGNSIRNSGSISGQTELNVSSSDIQNSGTLSTPGNINIGTPSASSININATGGKLIAGGDINVRTLGFSDKVDTTLTGGEWISSNLKIYSGEGHINANVIDITGGVTAHAGTAILHSDGEQLTIQDLVTTGDPLISDPGTIFLNSQSTNGNPLTVVAGRDIIMGSVNTNSTTGDAGDILLIAGASFSTGGGAIQVNGASATGGNITGTGAIISATSTVGNGGDITLAAFSTTSKSTGRITVESGEIRSMGGVGQANGNVTIIAPNQVWTGSINANGTGSGTAGNILVSTSEPIIVGPLQISQSTGAVLSGSLTPGPVSAGSLSPGPVYGIATLGSVRGGQVTVSSFYPTISSVDATIGAELTSYSYIAAFQVVTPSLTINMLGDSPAHASIGGPGVNNISSFASTGGGVVRVYNSTDLIINGVGANQTLEAFSDTQITIANDLTTSGQLEFTTTSLLNTKNVTAGSIKVFSPSDPVTIDGGTGGSFTATGVDQKVVFGSWLGSITVAGNLNFGSDAEFTVSSSPSPITIASLANIVGQESITINAQNVFLNGSIAADPLVINYSAQGGTIANSDGDVVLTGPIIMNGGDLAILARGAVTSTGPLTINTSSATGDGGSVFIWSGVEIWPKTPGQIVDSFTIFDMAWALSGTVSLADVNINTSSANGAGGNVLISANGGTLTIGNIDASGTTRGGTVRLYGNLGVSAGNINASGTVGGALEAIATNIETRDPDTFYILNGSVIGEVPVAPYSFNTGPVSVGSVNVGNGNIRIRAKDISVGSSLTAHDIYLEAPDTINLSALVGGLSAQQDSAGNGGHLTVMSQDLLYVSSSANPFILNADGSGSGNGGSITFQEYADRTATYVGNIPNAKAGAQFLELSAESGTGFGADGGKIFLGTAGDLTINMEKLSAAPRGTGACDGAEYELFSQSGVGGIGSLIIIGDLRADGLNGGAGGRIELSLDSRYDFVVNSTKTPKNGITGILSASGIGGHIMIRNYNKDIVVKTQEALQASSLFLGAASISVGKKIVLTADEIQLMDYDERSSKLITVDTKNLSVSGSLKGIENLGTETIAVTGYLYYTNFELVSHSSINLTQITSQEADMSFICTNGSITLAGETSPGVIGFVNAINGNIDLHNTDVNGTIELGVNSKIFTSQSGGDITISLGKTIKGKHTLSPTNVNAVWSAGGKAFFEPNADIIDAQGATTLVRAFSHDVLISNSTAQKITFLGNNRIEAVKEPGFKSLGMSSEFAFANLATESITSVAKINSVPTSDMTNSSSAGSGFASTANSRMESTNSLVSNTILSTTSFLETQNAILSLPTNIDSKLQIGSTLPTDLLNLGIASTIAPIALASPDTQRHTAVEFTDAYFWSDEDLGLEESCLLRKQNRAVSSTESASGSEAEVAHLRKGVVLVAPSKKTQLNTPFGSIEVSPDAVALVVLNDSHLAVYDLHDARKGSIRVSSKTKTTTLSPGRCIVLTGHPSPSFEIENPMSAFGYRTVTSHEHGKGLRAFNAEFSTLSALNTMKPLRSLLSSQHVGAKRMSAKLLKTSAVLMHLGSEEEFKRFAEPSFVAMH